MTISNNSTGLRPGVTTLAGRPTNPYTGQTIYQTDTNQLFVWNGTAWVIPNQTTQNPTGLELVKSQIVGASVPDVVVSNAFSATYDNYKIIYSGGSGSSGALLCLRLGTTVSGYYTSYVLTSWGSTVSAIGSTTNTSIERFGRAGSQDNTYGHGDLFSPFLPRNTRFIGQDMVTGDVGAFYALLPNNTSYTDLTIFPSSGLLTGGTISVYGYRK